MSYVDKTVGLYAEVSAEHHIGRGRYIYAHINVVSRFSDMKTQLHILYGERSICLFDVKSELRYALWLRNDGVVYTEYDPPRDVLIPIDAGFTRVAEAFRVYALGFISYKTYSVTTVPDTKTIDGLEVPYRYLSIQIRSGGGNMRYGVTVYNIPLINRMYIEHVHVTESDAQTDITVTLFTNRM